MTRQELLLESILRLLVLMARWMMDSKDADYRTRETWYQLRDGIATSETVIKGVPS